MTTAVTGLLFDSCPTFWNMITGGAKSDNAVFTLSTDSPMSCYSGMFFGEYNIVKRVQRSDDRLWGCILKNDKKLMHVKALRWIMLEEMLNTDHNMRNVISAYTVDQIREFYKNSIQFMVAYGLLSHREQLAYIVSLGGEYTMFYQPFLAQGNFRDDVDFPGILSFCGSRLNFPVLNPGSFKIFDTFCKDIIDGYIAPRLWAPWKTDGFDSEVLLFSPRDSLKSCGVCADNLDWIKFVDLKTDLYKQFKSLTTWLKQGDVDTLVQQYIRPVQSGGVLTKGINIIYGRDNAADVYKQLELVFECVSDPYNYKFQCDISTLREVRTLIITIFARVAMLLKECLLYIFDGDKTFIEANLKKHLGPSIANEVYLLKPGITHDTVYRAIMAADTFDNLVDTLRDDAFKYIGLSEFMGATYGILTHSGWFYIYFDAVLTMPEDKLQNYPILSSLKPKITKVIEVLKQAFGLQNMEGKDILKLLQTHEKLSVDSNKIINPPKNGMRSVFLDMIVRYPEESSKISIARNGIVNKDYIRKRMSKGVKEEYKYTRPLPVCPRYATPGVKSLMMVDGNEWYTMTTDSFFQLTMAHLGRVAKAGPSGSTFMWMNMCYGVLGLQPSKGNLLALLLAIISDFVPAYHSLAEVLAIFSIELLNYKSVLEDYGEANLYSYDQNPVQWLETFITKFFIPSGVRVQQAAATAQVQRADVNAQQAQNAAAKLQQAAVRAQQAQIAVVNAYDPNNFAHDFPSSFHYTNAATIVQAQRAAVNAQAQRAAVNAQARQAATTAQAHRTNVGAKIIETAGEIKTKYSYIMSLIQSALVYNAVTLDFNSLKTI